VDLSIIKPWTQGIDSYFFSLNVLTQNRRFATILHIIRMKITIASDHAGFKFKRQILQYLSDHGIEAVDLGTESECSVDYPDYAIKVAQGVSEGSIERGILICGTGIGMSIVANKFPGVRAALCHNEATAKASRSHNDANILVLGERVISEDAALSILEIWLRTDFDGGHHQQRLDKIREIEVQASRSDTETDQERDACQGEGK